MKRSIIKIDEEKCNGCGHCIPNCPEGALQIIDGKACLISDLFCDGLGACIGECPNGAIKTEVRDAEPYNESKVMQKIVSQGENVIIAHLEHLQNHNEKQLLDEALIYLKFHNIDVPNNFVLTLKEGPGCSSEFSGCPGLKTITIEKTMHSINSIISADSIESAKANLSHTPTLDKNKIFLFSELRQWPIQLKLIPVQAAFYQNSHLLISADCVGFSNPNFHQQLLKNKILIIACPKLDDSQYYIEKLGQIFALNSINRITIAMMEVPCCSGLGYIVNEALRLAKKTIPIEKLIYSIKGEIIG
jgi:NAD-dependent dihydropyrimidine dehydrogenase PreA subunit